MNTIGARLKEERERLSYNQTDFGTIGGVKRNAQVSYESDKRSPDATYLASVAKIGVDVQYVIVGVRSKNLNEIFAMVQPLKDKDELLGTLELLKKDMEKAIEIAKKRAEESKES